jgi:hypothetical protein
MKQKRSNGTQSVKCKPHTILTNKRKDALIKRSPPLIRLTSRLSYLTYKVLGIGDLFKT